MHEMLTVIRYISGLQELGGESAVGVLVWLLMPRLSVLPVSAPKCSLLGGARRDPPPSTLHQQHRQLREPPQENHGQIMPKKQKRPKRLDQLEIKSEPHYCLDFGFFAG